MLALIKNDFYCIAKRLKQIDEAYFVFFNNRDLRFEVHNSENPRAVTLCFIVPYAELDERTLEHACRTRVENFDQIEAEINAHNAALEGQALGQVKQSSAVLDDMMSFAARSEREVIFGKGVRWF